MNVPPPLSTWRRRTGNIYRAGPAAGDLRVIWDDDSRSALEVALNEADVLGIRLEPQGRWCDLLLHVLALPEAGPIDPDPRRILRLLSPTDVRVLLRKDRPDGYGAAIPLGDLNDVESFFESLSWAGSMYGWKFFDEPALTADWPRNPSLAIKLRSQPAEHSLFWFNECGRDEQQDKVSYCIEGLVRFDDLQVLDADGRGLSLEAFIADGHRWWEALHCGDDRLSVEAQHRAQGGAQTWRPRLAQTTVTTISGRIE